MNGVLMEPHKNIEWRYGALMVRFWRFEIRFRPFFRNWHTKKYTYYNTGKIGGRKGFVILFYPFDFVYQENKTASGY